MNVDAPELGQLEDLGINQNGEDDQMPTKPDFQVAICDVLRSQYVIYLWMLCLGLANLYSGGKHAGISRRGNGVDGKFVKRRLGCPFSMLLLTDICSGSTVPKAAHAPLSLKRSLWRATIRP